VKEGLRKYKQFERTTTTNCKHGVDGFQWGFSKQQQLVT